MFHLLPLRIFLSRRKCLIAASVAAVCWAVMPSAFADAPVPPVDASRFEVNVLATDLQRPMELVIAEDGTLFYIELDGKLKMLTPGDEKSSLVGELTVTTEQENGLIGIALDPKFAENRWIYLQYSPPDYPGQHISRFTLVDGKLDLTSEKVLFKFTEQRKECCHHAGSMAFGPHGNLFIGTGDNTHPHGDSNGWAPIDERPNRAPWDAQKSAANTRSGSGKILRIKPTPDGGYEIPDGNLFPGDGSQGLPEIYAMGCRNPWRMTVDAKTGFVYWGEVGPDAHNDGPRGPQGYDEINQARRAGNFGWPYFIANNQPYADWDFATKKLGEKFDVAAPINESPNNTGIRELPPAQPALLYYPYGKSAEFPELGEGGRTACAGPVYHDDKDLVSATKFPPHYDGALFIYEWSRHWIKAVHLTDDGDVQRIEPFLPEHKFVRPIDMVFGPEGSLYMIEYGETWGVNKDARIVRIDYVAGNRRPLARASAANNFGREPLDVALSSEGTFDKDNGDKLSYRWRALRAGDDGSAAKVLSDEANPTVTFDQPGIYNVELTVTDSHGASSSASVPVVIGNARPTVRFVTPLAGDFYDPDQPLPFRIYVKDDEDGTSDGDEADELDIDFIDPAAPERVSVSAALVQGPLTASDGEETGPLGMRLMKRSDCFNCHAVDQKRVGPPLVEIATKYRDVSGALEASVKRVREGSTGAWGKIPMIPHAQHTADEVREMVTWIYSLEADGGLRVFEGFSGEIPAVDDPEKQSGRLVLEVNYRDRGAEGIPPLTSTATVVLRPRRIEGENADVIHGPLVLNSGTAHGKKFLGAINHGHFARFNDVPLDRVGALTLTVASAGTGGQIEVRLDKPDGPKIATADVEVNGQWEGWYRRKVPIVKTAGTHDLFFVFVNPKRPSGLMNLDAVYFHP